MPRPHACCSYFPIEEGIAYLNLDMVGYRQDLSAHVSTAHEMLPSVITESVAELGMHVSVLDYSEGNDRVPFEENGLQNAMRTYWPDEFYRTAADKAQHVSKTSLFERAKLAAMVILKLGEAPPLVTSKLKTETSVSSTMRSLAARPLATLLVGGVVAFAGAI